MFKVNNKDTRTTPYFTPCFSVSIVNFEQVDAGWNTTRTGDLHINSLSEKLLGITFDCK